MNQYSKMELNISYTCFHMYIYGNPYLIFNDMISSVKLIIQYLYITE